MVIHGSNRGSLGHLSRDECEKILAVLQKDFDIRKKEQDRISKIEEELNEKASQRIVLAKRKEFNEKWCILCCSTFNLLFNRKLHCNDCHFFVCRNCAAWESQEKVWLCRICDHQRTLYIQSCEWFYDHIRQKFKHFGRAKLLDHLYKKKKESADSENDSGYGPSSLEPSSSQASRHVFLSVLSSNLHHREDATSPTGENVPLEEDNGGEEAECRQHLESIVEGLLGENLDSARVDHVYANSQYCKLFQDFIKKLSEKVDNLGRDLREAITNRASNVSPTTSHAALKNIIEELTEEVSTLPELEEVNEAAPPTDGASGNDDFFTNYNDLMAAAIINKVVEKSQRRFPRHPKSITSNGDESVCLSETLTDGQSSPEFTWIPGEKMECVQVEEIQEIREYHQDPDPEKAESVTETVVTSTRSVPEEELADLDYLSFWGPDLGAFPDGRVPFPEFGRDLIDSEVGSNLPEDVDTCLLNIESWEDNWLFRKKKRLPTFGVLSKHLLNYYFDPPCMLIPRPFQESQVCIGEMEVDQLSELSEGNSFGSIEFSTSSEGEISDQEIESYSPKVKKENSNSSRINHTNRTSPPPRVIMAQSKVHPLLKEENAEEKPQSHTLPHPIPKPRSLTPEGLAQPTFLPPSKRPKPSREPSFLSAPESLTLHAGKMARFECKVAGSKPLGVIWFSQKKEAKLEQGSKCLMYSPCQGTYRLDMYNTEVEDSGQYSCLVYSKQGQNWADFHLKVKPTSRAELPPEFTESPKEISPGSVQCTISGYPEPQLLIYRADSGVSVLPSHKYSLEDQGCGVWVLEIKNFGQDDAGEYNFILQNPLGQVMTQLTLSFSEVDSSNNKEKEEYSKEDTTDKYLADNEEDEDNLQPLYSTSEMTTNDIKKIDAPSIIEETPKTNRPDIPINAPPRPGTIAEREHLKWQNAPPLPNNPYSAANLSKRRDQQLRDWVIAGRPMTFEEFARRQDMVTDLSGTDDSLLSENELSFSHPLQRYQRDYYVNNLNRNITHSGSLTRTSSKDLGGPEETLNSLEEKVYIRAGKVFTIENGGGVKRLEREVHSEELLQDPKDAERDFDHYNIKEREERPVVWCSTPGLQKPPPSSTPSSMTLPCVKHLASKFSSVSPLVNQQEQQQEKNGDKGDAVPAVAPRKTPFHNTGKTGIKVHSLTARSLSKEFRESAQKNLPRPMNRNISYKGESGTESTHGYTSDESTASSSSFSQPPASKIRKAKTPASKAILQRASYWEKRVEQGLLSDTSVNEEFPALEHIPR